MLFKKIILSIGGRETMILGMRLRILEIFKSFYKGEILDGR